MQPRFSVSGRPGRAGGEDRILQERFARDEMSREEYEEKKKVLS
ncbi:MAG: SHOCT domain-containing protein [Pseudomonadota bacterium]